MGRHEGVLPALLNRSAGIRMAPLHHFNGPIKHMPIGWEAASKAAAAAVVASSIRGADGECRLTSYAVTDGSLAWCDGSRSSCATDLVLCCAIGCPLVCISAGLVWWRMSLTRPQE